MTNSVWQQTRRPRRPLTEKQRKQALLAVLRTEQHQIVNALQYFARGMDEAAEQARRDWEAGQTDPQILTAQDATMITNHGCHQLTQMFTAEASRARRIASELAFFLDRDDEDEDEDQ